MEEADDRQDSEECDNCRDSSVSFEVAKIVAKIVLERIKNHLEKSAKSRLVSALDPPAFTTSIVGIIARSLLSQKLQPK